MSSLALRSPTTSCEVTFFSAHLIFRMLICLRSLPFASLGRAWGAGHITHGRTAGAAACVDPCASAGLQEAAALLVENAPLNATVT